MISVTSSPVTKTETVGTMIDMETGVVRVTDGQHTGMINETNRSTKTDITKTRLLREIGDLMIDITKTRGDREIDITKAMDMEIDVMMTMLMLRDIATIMETETGTMSTLRE